MFLANLLHFQIIFKMHPRSLDNSDIWNYFENFMEDGLRKVRYKHYQRPYFFSKGVKWAT